VRRLPATELPGPVKAGLVSSIVCERMGLLDDAIREHLELKRLRGTDPGEIALREREALGPVDRDREATPGDYGEDGEGIAARAPTKATRGSQSGSPTAGQETVELDMEAVIESGGGATVPASQASGTDPASHSREPLEAHEAEESLEWEVPGDKPEQDSEGQHRLGHTESEKSVEDVLEETPDFLRDTPEQERLWFEQRPPRDFDFNE
jgi:hypothetical protein